MCATSSLYSRIINISQSYYRYLDFSKANLDNFQNFLYEFSAKLLGFFFVDSCQKFLKHLNLFKRLKTFQNLKHFVGVSLCFMLLRVSC